MVMGVFAKGDEMKLQHYIQQIEDLLWTGRIEGIQILELHRLLRAYMSGKASEKVLQETIELNDRDWIA